MTQLTVWISTRMSGRGFDHTFPDRSTQAIQQPGLFGPGLHSGKAHAPVFQEKTDPEFQERAFPNPTLGCSCQHSLLVLIRIAQAGFLTQFIAIDRVRELRRVVPLERRSPANTSFQEEKGRSGLLTAGIRTNERTMPQVLNE